MLAFITGLHSKEIFRDLWIIRHLLTSINTNVLRFIRLPHDFLVIVLINHETCYRRQTNRFSSLKCGDIDKTVMRFLFT